MCVHKSKGKTLKKRFSKKRGLGERKKKKKTTNLSQRHRQLSSILIPTSQQFDTEWFFFFFFFWFSSFCNRRRNSSQVLNRLLLLLPTNFASAKIQKSEEIQRASSHTQGTNKQGGKKIPVEKPRNTGNS